MDWRGERLLGDEMKKVKLKKVTWMLIESAPHDGSLVIVAGGMLKPTAARYSGYFVGHAGKKHWRTELAKYKVEPTHWLPVEMP